MVLKKSLVAAAVLGLITAGLVATPASAQVVEREKYAGTEPFAHRLRRGRRSRCRSVQ
jgi:hypothetical protein